METTCTDIKEQLIDAWVADHIGAADASSVGRGIWGLCLKATADFMRMEDAGELPDGIDSEVSMDEVDAAMGRAGYEPTTSGRRNRIYAVRYSRKTSSDSRKEEQSSTKAEDEGRR